MVALIIVVAQSTAMEMTDKDEAKKAEAFYQQVNETILHELKLYSKRVDCIVNDLKHNYAMLRVNESNYQVVQLGDGSFNVTFMNKDIVLMQLKESIDSGVFSCVIVGYCAIALIISVMLIVVGCVSCLSKKK